MVDSVYRSIYFYRAAWMRELSVRLSVRLSNACIVTKCPDLHTVLKIILSLVFWEEEWLVRATTSTWNFGSTCPHLAKKSSINTNRKSTTRFPMSLRWSSYVAPKPPKGAQKRKKANFRLKSDFAWRKSATKFLCVNTVSGKVLRHSLA